MFKTSRGTTSKNSTQESLERGETTAREGSDHEGSAREGSTVGILPGILPVAEGYNHNGHKVTPGWVIIRGAESFKQMSDC